jgi:hypothetical protein
MNILIVLSKSGANLIAIIVLLFIFFIFARLFLGSIKKECDKFNEEKQEETTDEIQS